MMRDEQIGTVARYTDMMLDLSESYSLDASDITIAYKSVEHDDLREVYAAVSKEKGVCESYCLDCSEMKFYDEWENSYYCPVCEDQ